MAHSDSEEDSFFLSEKPNPPKKRKFASIKRKKRRGFQGNKCKKTISEGASRNPDNEVDIGSSDVNNGSGLSSSRPGTSNTEESADTTGNVALEKLLNSSFDSQAA